MRLHATSVVATPSVDRADGLGSLLETPGRSLVRSSLSSLELLVGPLALGSPFKSKPQGNFLVRPFRCEASRCFRVLRNYGSVVRVHLGNASPVAQLDRAIVKTRGDDSLFASFSVAVEPQCWVLSSHAVFETTSAISCSTGCGSSSAVEHWSVKPAVAGSIPASHVVPDEPKLLRSRPSVRTRFDSGRRPVRRRGGQEVGGHASEGSPLFVGFSMRRQVSRRSQVAVPTP